MILQTINSPNDIKKLDFSQLNELSKEIREFLIENVLVTGGHLASNLGVVELTLAIHKVFDLPEDKLIFDVGHQSYVHKIITGRMNDFSTLRSLNGLSGFPKPEESPYDSFIAGHASTSISAAVGMARARDLNNDNYNVIALIGDGALTGGMTFEAFNDIGQKKCKVIIILNDNEMAIERNVGGLSEHLSRIRYNKKYLNTKQIVSSFLNDKGEKGQALSSFLKKIKSKFKYATVAEPYFESIGVKYIGIVDGHNIKNLCEIFEKIKNVDGPVVIHTLTKKGSGYKDAEINPEKYHGVSRNTTQSSKYDISYSNATGMILSEIAEKNDKVVAITAAMKSGCGLSEFEKKHSNRFFDVGIAEEHAVTMAAGMASQGIVPVFCVYSTFLQRAYDQIIHDVCIQNSHVVFAIDRAGVVGDDGETHQGVFDLSYLSHIPNMTILTPSTYDELRQMFYYAINECTGPVAVRYPKGVVSSRESETPFKVSTAEKILPPGDISIIACGSMTDTAINTAKILNLKGISCGVLNLRTIKPIDKNAVKEYCKSKIIYTIEDNVIAGGMGTLVSQIAMENKCKCKNLGFPDKFIKQGKQSEIFDIYSLTAEKLSEMIEKELCGYEL